jgi:acetyl esterase/lipase
MFKRIAVAFVVLFGSLFLVGGYVTPWPSVLVIRALFDFGTQRTSTALVPRVPANISVQADLSYDPGDPDAGYDVYRGTKARNDGPTIVWFHGGGFVSGRRGDVANYLKILAGHGFTVVNLDYSLAPKSIYPMPIKQAHKALDHLTRNAEKLNINANRFVLAGDSAGAQIAAQTAATIANPAYARAVGVSPGADVRQLAGTLLFCGVYDVSKMGKGGGVTGWFVNSVIWAYSGSRDSSGDNRFATMSVTPHLNPGFPPTFISAGNADPLEPQSVALAQTARKQGVATTELFFPANHKPSLAHEYQFDLDSEDGRLTLTRSVTWLNSL